MKFYVGAYTEGFFGEGPNGSEGIYLCEYEEKDNNFKVIKSFPDSVNPSFLKLTRDKKRMYVACETLPPSRLDAYKVDEDGMLTFFDTTDVPTYRSCCYVSVDKDNSFISVANYGTAEIFTYSLDEDGKYKEITSAIRNENNEVGPNTERQDIPHVHSTRLIEALDIYVSCDLGCDKISFFTYQKGGYFKKLYDIKTPAGVGPRHSINTKDGKYLYITCELGSAVLVYEYVDNKYVYRQMISSQPEDYKGINACSDIHLSIDEKYVFVSNRGHNSIGQFKILEDGTLEPVKFVFCGGDEPRNFAVWENYIICANQYSNVVSVLEIENGYLTGKILNSCEFISPACIEKF